jgi:hypothetical protein
MIVSVLPFLRTFTYLGSEIKDAELYNCYKGEIDLRRFLVSFKRS